MQEYLIVAPAAVFGGILIWVMIFFETYRHFPRMEKRERVWMSVNSATMTALIFIVVIFVSMAVLIRWILK